MSSVEESRVSQIVKELEQAWNAGSGEAFARPFADDADFVNVRGLHMRSREAIAKGHQGIFDSIYKGSRNEYLLSAVRELAPGVLLAHVRATLNVPAGPLAGVHHALFSLVIVEAGGDWRIVAFQNTGVAS